MSHNFPLQRPDPQGLYHFQPNEPSAAALARAFNLAYYKWRARRGLREEGGMRASIKAEAKEASRAKAEKS